MSPVDVSPAPAGAGSTTPTDPSAPADRNPGRPAPPRSGSIVHTADPVPSGGATGRAGGAGAQSGSSGGATGRAGGAGAQSGSSGGATGRAGGAGARAAARVVRSRFEALGTYGELLLDGHPAALGTAVRLLTAELAAIDLACSRFRDDSELMAVNAAAGRTVPVSDLFAEAVEVALLAAAQTDGDVDPTLGGALVAAGYDADYAALPADGPPVAAAPPRPGAWREVELDRAAGTLRVPADVRLDLGATAKALGVDRAAAAIAAATGAGVLVNVGGDLSAAGPLPAAGWQVRLTDDTTRTDVARPGRTGPVVGMHGGGLATSSTVVRRWRRGGQAYHHVLDPRTGLPAEPVWRTVTVTAASCVDANTASTAAVVRGWGAAEWLAALGLPSRLVDVAGSVHRIAGWPPDHDDGAADDGAADDGVPDRVGDGGGGRAGREERG